MAHAKVKTAGQKIIHDWKLVVLKIVYRYTNFWEDQSFDLISMKVVTECAQCKALLFAKGY